MAERPKSLFKQQRQTNKIQGSEPSNSAFVVHAPDVVHSPDPLLLPDANKPTAPAAVPVSRAGMNSQKQTVNSTQSNSQEPQESSPARIPNRAQSQPSHEQAASSSVPTTNSTLEWHQSGQEQGGQNGWRGWGGALGEKVERYERFVDEKLKVKLNDVQEARGVVVADIEAYERLRSTLQMINSEKMTTMKTSINVGCDLYMQAVVPDTSRIMVDVGLGFFAELAISEALDFIEKKVSLLQKRVDDKSKEAAELSSQIDVVLKGISELLNLPPTQATPVRGFL